MQSRKLLEDNIGESRIGLEFNDYFLDITLKAQSINEIILKVGFHSN